MESRILSDTESLKVELLTLKTQILNEQKKSVEYQQVIVNLRKENLELKGQLLEAENDKTLINVGIIGNNKITRLEDGKYKVEPQNGAVEN
jgi:hypothetical protein